MRAYRLSTNLKLGLVLFAVLIAVASLGYTHQLANRLRERERAITQLWASATVQLAQAAQQQSFNPHQADFLALDSFLVQLPSTPGLVPDALPAWRDALAWAQGQPSAGELTFLTEALVLTSSFGIPAIVVDSTGQEPLNWRNVPEVPEPDSVFRLPPEARTPFIGQLARRAAQMDDDAYPPIPIEVDYGASRLKQFVHYDESLLIRELRFFPFLQLLFVGLFILIGYLGFSYVRRSEQRSLWVGMAKEAAHQLGTPISSLMGWTELLRLPALPAEQRQLAVEEIDKDIVRLGRVANRFSDIGSLPRLEVQPLAPLLEVTADYMRRRIPQQGQQIDLTVHAPATLRASVNAELFEWVIENLLKNALDAIETPTGRIQVRASASGQRVLVDVEDTGKGIDRREWKNVFRPGYSTKQRGWGLGLSLAKRIIEDYHGGRLLLAQSRPGEGTTFRIELPAMSG
jgi:hypothetical protein